jgi:hypothetical protein
MFRSPFLDWLKRQRQNTNNRPVRVARDSRQRKLCVEPLEDRTLLNATVLDVSTTTTPNSTLLNTQTLNVRVDFNAPVTVTGAPQVALNDSLHSVATYQSGNGTSSLNFSLTVPVNDTAARVDYTGSNALALNGGTIIDLNDPGAADLTLPAPASANDVLYANNIAIDSNLATVTGVAPSAGPLTSGTSVTITGTDFTGATAVNFGANPATSFTVVSNTQITATTPAGSAGVVNITVVNDNGTSATSAADQFTYDDVPTITGVVPSAGPLGGGTPLQISGTNFTAGSTVTIGGAAATSVTFVSATQLDVVVPAGTAGAADVVVTTPGGSATAVGAFTYSASAPSLSGISPTAGPVAGGTQVTITGTNLGGATNVDFGGVNLGSGSFTVNGAGTAITLFTPAGSAGTANVVVTTASGVSNAVQFTYAAVPTVTVIAPSAGPLAGGTSVVITGTGFTGATAVNFGGTAATSFTVNSDTQITAVAPAGSSGTVDVTITTVGGTSATGAADQYTYTAAPTVTGLSPTSGPTSGGTTVVITGTGFTGATAVNFGGTAATSFTVDSDTQITATAPAGSAGAVDVTVVTVGGTSATSASDKFTYIAAPTITSIVPTSGPLGGGTTVIITGTGFTGATAVNFGGTAATSFTVDSDTQITATAPAESAGTVDVSVTTGGGTSTAGASDHYTYLAAPTVTHISTGAGPAAGGNTVVITGTGFIGVSAVKFGTTPASTFTVDSDTQITVTVPAGSAGTVDVIVTTSGGTSSTSAVDQYTYVAAPVVSGITPSAGPTSGGTVVTITGTGFTDAMAVNFGAHAATTFTVVSDTQITATAPAGSAGAVDVTVSTVGGTSAVGAADHFTYAAVPAITAITPVSGSTSGGDTVIITGTGFTGASAVNFGSATAVFHVDSATQITAVVPAGAAGAVNVTVTTVGGTSAPAQFTYVAPTPAETPAPAPSPAPTIPQQIQRLFQDLITYQINLATGNTAGAISAAVDFQATLAALQQEIFQLFLNSIHHS